MILFFLMAGACSGSDPRIDSMLLENPRLGTDKLVFVKRETFHSSHFYTDFIDGCSRFGGNLCILNLRTGEVTDLAGSMKDGIFGRFDLHFSAKKVVFDWKKQKSTNGRKVKETEGFRIYEVDIDPVRGVAIGKPRQLTFTPDDEQARIKKYDNSFLGGFGRMYYHQTDDMHPCYLPDGGIMFTSSRSEHGTLCDAADTLSSVTLHRLERDGSIRKLTESAVSEFSPVMMEDGRVLYSRWEYVDKGQLGIKCLWAMNPDGTSSVEIYGNDIQFPPTFLHGRQIPGEATKFVFLGTPHYPQSGIGTVIVADTTKNIRNREPMRYITSNVDVRQEGGWNQERNGKWVVDQLGPLYMDPFPLSEHEFLVAHNPDRKWDDPSAYGIYLLTGKGVHVKIHDDPETSCWQPIPLKPRKTPPVRPSLVNPKLAKKGLSLCIVQDVHYGMDGIEHGEVKFIRVMEQVSRPWDSRRFWDPHSTKNSHTNLIGAGSLSVKAMWGVVPVEEDGSAYFYVPANRNVYFQALDENYMELQRERTYINYMPGEESSCIGCHELHSNAPLQKQRTLLALAKAPVMPGPQPGDKTGKRAIHYPSYVQPVLEKYCVECHGDNAPEADLNLTGELTRLFSVSYENLIRRGAAPNYREGSDWEGSFYAPPKSIGSHKSKLLGALRGGKGHKDLKLPKAALARLATWIDAGGQYYGSWWGRKHIEYKDHPFFRPVPTFEEAIGNTCPVPMEKR